MEFVVEINEEKQVVIVRLSGAVTVESLVPLALQKRTLAREMGYGVVVDFREATICISQAEAFYVLDKHYNPIDPALKYVRTAYVVAEKDIEFFTFLEVSWVNRGARIRVFEGEQGALGWLESLCVDPSSRGSLREFLICTPRI